MTASGASNDSSYLRYFFLIWFGQMISVIGSGLTLFALTWWMWTTYKSGLALAGAELFTSAIAPVLIGPIAGVYVDRYNRRTVMLLGDTINGLMSLVILGLFLANLISPLWIYVLGFLSSVALTFHAVAFDALVPMLVPEKHLGRANGLLQLNLGASVVLAPLVAGALLGFGLSITTLIVIDIATFLLAVALLAAAKTPKIEAAPGTAPTGHLWTDVQYGFRYIWNRPGLFWVLMVIALASLLWNPYSIWLPQMITEHFKVGPEWLGTINSAMGLTYILGTLVMSAWGGPPKRVWLVVGLLPLKAGLMIIAGFANSVWVALLTLSVAAFTIPFQNGASQALWQAKVPREVMGRVLAVRRSLVFITKPISLVIAGFLSPDIIPAHWALGGAGIIGIIVLGLCLLIPVVRNVDDVPKSAALNPRQPPPPATNASH